MFDVQFLRKYPEFAVCEGVQLALLPPRMRPKPLDDVIRDDEELDTRIKSEKKKIPEGPEAVVFAKVHLPPHVWFQLPVENNDIVRIQDAVLDDYPAIMKMLSEHRLPVEPLCKATHFFDDEEGIKEYRHLFMHYVSATTSLVAYNSQNKMIGVLIGKIEDVDECSEKAFHKTVFKSKRIQTMFNLISFMVKTVNFHEKYNTKVYFRIFVIVVHKDWENIGVEKALITAILKICSVFKIWRIAGVFTMYKDQYYLRQFGATKEFEVYYSEWKTDRGLRIFRGTGKTEPKAVFMTLPVPESFLTSAEEQPPLTPLTSERARRFIEKRLYLWDELDIDRYCSCLAITKTTKKRKQRRMKKMGNTELEVHSSQSQSLNATSSRKFMINF